MRSEALLRFRHRDAATVAGAVALEPGLAAAVERAEADCAALRRQATDLLDCLQAGAPLQQPAGRKLAIPADSMKHILKTADARQKKLELLQCPPPQIFIAVFMPHSATGGKASLPPV